MTDLRKQTIQSPSSISVLSSLPLKATMSQKSSLAKTANSVLVLTADKRPPLANAAVASDGDGLKGPDYTGSRLRSLRMASDNRFFSTDVDGLPCPTLV